MPPFTVTFLLDLIICGALPGAEQNMLNQTQVFPVGPFHLQLKQPQKKEHVASDVMHFGVENKQ